MTRPFMLYHWSPSSRREAILHDGLCPRKISVDGDWRPPVICFCRFPNSAWALSGTHHPEVKAWDLWCTWSDSVKYKTVNVHGRKQWSLTEYRCDHRVPKRMLWYVGSRKGVR